MNPEPDSEAPDYEEIEVADTLEYDNPQFGAVTVQLWHHKNHSQSLRMSMRAAVELSKALDEYFEKNSW